MNRRQTLGTMGAFLVSLSLPRLARASSARAATLTELLTRSTRIAHVMPLEGWSRFEDIGQKRHIVTYTRLRIDEAIAGQSGESEILVRTLGGHVGKLGEIVHGEAQLMVNEACLVFLRANADGIEEVTEMAQGHYPFEADAHGTLRLRASRNLPYFVGGGVPAAAQLTGLEAASARELIRGMRQ